MRRSSPTPEFSAWVARAHAGGTLGRAGEIAGAAVFLASSAADYVTGPSALRRRRLPRGVLTRSERRSARSRALQRVAFRGIIGCFEAGTAATVTPAVPASHVRRSGARSRNARARPTRRAASRIAPSTCPRRHRQPRPRAAVRAGDARGPGAGRRHGVPRPRDRRDGHAVGRGRVQHRDDGLPGDPHRSVVRRPDRHAHLSAHRQRRRQCRGRRVAAHLRRGPRDPRPAARRVELALATATWRRTCATHNIVGIADIDTRKLTRILREKGAQNGCIVGGREPGRRRRRATPSRGRGRRRRWRGSISRRSCPAPTPYEWSSGTWALGDGLPADGRRRASTSSPTTTASSTTSCACSPSAAAG